MPTDSWIGGRVKPKPRTGGWTRWSICTAPRAWPSTAHHAYIEAAAETVRSIGIPVCGIGADTGERGGSFCIGEPGDEFDDDTLYITGSWSYLAEISR
jgi:hypothetical protein